MKNFDFLEGRLIDVVREVEEWDFNSQLDDLPAMKAWAESLFVLAEQKVKKAKHEHKKEMNKALLLSERPNATEKKAEAENKAEGWTEIIKSETNRNLIQAKFNYLSDKFLSARKQCGLLEKQLLDKQ